MRRIFFVMLAALGLCLPLAAQETVKADPEFQVQSRIKAEFEKKIFKDFKFSVSEELRLPGRSMVLDRSYTGVGLSYRVNQYFKAGASYDFVLDSYRNDEDKGGYRIRHRAKFDLEGRYLYGPWEFSIRERFMALGKPGELNLYQEPRTNLSLYSRFRTKYNNPGWAWSPYAAIEFKNTLNAVSFASGESRYDNVYLTRVRLSLGTGWRLNRSNSFDFYTLWDYNYQIDYDATKKGKLKSITEKPSFCLSIGIAYKFAM